MKKKMYRDEKTKEWRYEESQLSSSTELAARKTNQPAVRQQDFALQAREALQFNSEQSAIGAKVQGWGFRSKTKTMTRNLEAGTEVANKQREFIEASMELEKAKDSAANLFEQTERERLENDVKIEKLQTQKLKQKKKQAELSKSIHQAITNEEADGGANSQPTTIEDLVDEQVQSATAKLEAKAKVMEFYIGLRGRMGKKMREEYPDRTDEEIDDMLDRLLVESDFMPE